jgi:hypothetical protein
MPSLLRSLPLAIVLLLHASSSVAQSTESLSVADFTNPEGSTGTRNVRFNVTLDRVTCTDVCTVNYATQPNTAFEGSDYTATSGVLTFVPTSGACADQVLFVNVPVFGDTESEPTESLNLVLSNPVGCSISDAVGVMTLRNDDIALTVNDATSVTEAAGAVMRFSISVMHPSVTSGIVNWATANGTAVAGLDYTARNGTVTVPANSSGFNVDVPVLQDVLDEDDETVRLLLSEPTRLSIIDGEGVGAILDDDPPPTASIADAVLTEGSSVAPDAAFVVSLSVVSGRTVSIDWSTVDGTAIGGVDYEAASGTVTFPPGVTSQTIYVPVFDDILEEDEETFDVQLANAVHTTLVDSLATATIIDRDPPNIRVDDVSASETGTVTFTVSLSEPTTLDVTVHWLLDDGSALGGADFQDAEGDLVIPAGQTTGAIVVSILEDTIDESAESFTVLLASAINGTILDDRGTAIISDDDPRPTASIADASIVEGSGGATSAVLTVSLTNASTLAISLDWTTIDGSALQGIDYTAGSGTLTFAPGVTSQTIAIAVAGDLLDERDESFSIVLANPAWALLGDAMTMHRRPSRSPTAQSMKETPARSTWPSRCRSPRRARCRSRSIGPPSTRPRSPGSITSRLRAASTSRPAPPRRRSRSPCSAIDSTKRKRASR